MKITVCGNYGVTNIGDEAILLGLKRLILKCDPRAKITVLGLGTLLPIGIRSFLRSLFNFSRIKRPLEAIKNCDLFILGGGGLFTQEEHYFSAAFWALHGLIALLFKRKVAVIGVSIGILSGINKVLVRALLQRAGAVVVRDGFSLEQVQRWRVKAELLPDLAYYASAPLRGARFIKKSGLEPRYGIISVRDYNKFNNSLYKKIAQLCDAIIQNFGLEIRLIPFQYAICNDTVALNKIFEQMKYKNQAQVLLFTDNIIQILGEISRAEFMIGTRLHSCILSMINRVPFIPLSYMGKVNNIWSSAKFVNVFDIFDIQIDDIIKVLQNIIQNREKQIKIIDDEMVEIARGEKKYYGIISTCLTK